MKKTILLSITAALLFISFSVPKQKSYNMNNENFTSSIMVDKTPIEAFNAIKNFKSWWSEDIEGNTDQLNETFFYHYKDMHLCKIKLIEMVPGKKLVYQVVANEFSFTKDKTEWVNTKLVFDISTEGKQTKVTFTHEGLVPEYECYNVCHDAWTGFIQKSLKNLINTGKGEPNPKGGTNKINADNIKKWNLKN
ncbi:MAG TPA: SRPBCC domain-containing protein [Chitinophagaceae bacterium]|nr:SRPBCC domain-containing protein [Chitinophagaceae bacterium]